MDDLQTILNMVFSVSMMLAGWVLRTVWDAVKTLQNDIKEIERDLPSTYVRRDDYKDDMAEVKDILHKIFDRLDNKADK